MYPDVQKRAQAEIDSVTGRARLPTFDDRESMPYIEAICNEAVRWMPTLPLGLYRKTIDDDVYDKWFIPSGQFEVN
jgi:cytochrome P450